MSKAVNGVVIPVNGDAYPNHFTKLKDYQDIVGGYIEVAELVSGCAVIVNEDGLALKLPLNERASDMMRYPLYGNLIIVGGPDNRGNWTNLHPVAINSVIDFCEVLV